MLNKIKTQLSKAKAFMHRDDGSIKEKTLRSGAWLGISGIVINFLTFIRSIVLARLLTPEIFGLMGIGLMFIRAMDTITRSGVAEALIHRQDNVDEAKHTVFTILVARGFLLAIIIASLSPLIADFYGESALTPLIWLMAVSFPIQSFTNVNNLIKTKDLEFKRLAYIDQLGEVVNTSATIILAFWLQSVWALAIGHVISSTSFMLLSYIFIPGRPRFRFDLQVAKELFTYGKFITGVSIVLFIASELDKAVIPKILGIEQLGFYVLAFTTANFATTYIAKLASRVLFPAYSKLQHDKVALQIAYLSVVRFLGLIILPATIGLILLADELVLLLYGEKWAPASDVLKVLAVFGLLRSFTAVNGYLFNGMGKPKIDFYISVVRLVLIGLLILPLTINYGIVGTAIAVTVPMGFQLVLGVIWLKKEINLSFLVYLASFMGTILRCVAMVAIVLAGQYFLDLGQTIWLIGTILTAALLYAAISYKPLMKLVKEKN